MRTYDIYIYTYYAYIDRVFGIWYLGLRSADPGDLHAWFSSVREDVTDG